MTAQVIEIGGRPAIAHGAVGRQMAAGRPRVAADRRIGAVPRTAAVVILALLGLGLFGVTATAELAAAGATPPGGPLPGFGL